MRATVWFLFEWLHDDVILNSSTGHPKENVSIKIYVLICYFQIFMNSFTVGSLDERCHFALEAAHFGSQLGFQKSLCKNVIDGFKDHTFFYGYTLKLLCIKDNALI